MKKEIIRSIGEEKRVKNLDLFVKFISQRFPDEPNEIKYYVEEWADRFNGGSPEGYMDGISRSIYEELKNE